MHHKDIADSLRTIIKMGESVSSYESGYKAFLSGMKGLIETIEKDRETIRCFIVSSEDSVDTTKDLDSIILNLKKGD